MTYKLSLQIEPTLEVHMGFWLVSSGKQQIDIIFFQIAVRNIGRSLLSVLHTLHLLYAKGIERSGNQHIKFRENGYDRNFKARSMEMLR